MQCALDSSRIHLSLNTFAPSNRRRKRAGRAAVMPADGEEAVPLCVSLIGQRARGARNLLHPVLGSACTHCWEQGRWIPPSRRLEALRQRGHVHLWAREILK